MYYAIKHRRSGRFVSGTDFSCSDGRPRQILSGEARSPRLFTGVELSTQLKLRHINIRDYVVVAVKVVEVADEDV